MINNIEQYNDHTINLLKSLGECKYPIRFANEKDHDHNDGWRQGFNDIRDILDSIKFIYEKKGSNREDQSTMT